MLTKHYKSTEVDCRTWQHVPSGTHWSTSSDTHQVVEIQKETSTNIQREYHIILTKYEAVHPTDVSENYSSLENNYDKSPNSTNVFISSYIFAAKFTHIMSIRTK